MYRFYWHPTTSSYAPMAVLEELGVPFDLHEVDYNGGENRTPDYLRLQPLGLIPALELGDGRSMFESAAIVLYLCDRHREPELAPSQDDADRPRYLQWLFFMADTLYPSYNRFYRPARYTASPDGASDVKEQARRAMLAQWQVVEDALERNGPWLLGRRFSACDIYLQMLTMWHERPADLLAAFPHVRELAHGVIARDGCQRALKRHNFETGFETEPVA
ncbi:MAG: glutathione S-transferase family protein [Woeseiaceae bacterium]